MEDVRIAYVHDPDGFIVELIQLARRRQTQLTPRMLQPGEAVAQSEHRDRGMPRWTTTSERPKPPPDWDGSSITARISEPPPTAQKSCAFPGYLCDSLTRREQRAGRPRGRPLAAHSNGDANDRDAPPERTPVMSTRVSGPRLPPSAPRPTRSGARRPLPDEHSSSLTLEVVDHSRDMGGHAARSIWASRAPPRIASAITASAAPQASSCSGRHASPAISASEAINTSPTTM